MPRRKKDEIAEDTAQSAAETDPHRFVFELDRAIRDQVLEKLEQSPTVKLALDIAPKESGVYALFHKRTLVYVGKASKASTKSKRTLRSRINEHVRKISARQNISLDEMECRFLTIESDWFVWAAEFALINSFTPEWNNSGFGSKVPGAGRPGTDRVSKWNAMYPPKPGMMPDDGDEEGEDEDDGGDSGA